MKTRSLFFFSLLISCFSYAQQSYYDGVDLTKTGLDLRDELALKITNTHTNFLSYTPGIWEASRITDEDQNNTNNVILLYGWEGGADNDVTNDISRNKNSNGGSVGDWNREHTYPKSLGNPNLGTTGPGADAHHLRPTDVQRNGNRGSRKFAAGSGNSGTTAQGNWYPGDEWKGDVARMILYMYLRYGNRCLPNNVAIGTTNTIDSNMINLLLEWNAEDQVSSIEDNRNIYHDSNETYAQGNRNPFIDNPYLATAIWGGPVAQDRWGISSTDTEAPSIPTGLIVSNETLTTIDLSWSPSTDNVAVTLYEVYVNETYNTSVSGTSITVTQLTPENTYSFRVLAKDAANNSSSWSTAINGTTIGENNNSNELYISEYIEGSSFNKALEIANYTGNSIPLDNYQLRLSTNGASNWSTATYSFPNGASIANGEVFVITHTSFDLTCANLNTVNDTNNSITSFNGNDVIGLFKNNTLLDILGTLGNSSNYAKNTTLVRKQNIIAPTTTYNVNDWNTFSSNTCNDLGKHSEVSLSVIDFELDTIKVHSNSSTNDTISIVFPSSFNNANINIYDLTGKKIISKENISNQISISNLPKGMLLLEIISSKQRITKKIIIL